MVSFPAWDFSSANNITYAWLGCRGLTTFPDCDYPRVEKAWGAWSACENITKFDAALTFPSLTGGTGVTESGLHQAFLWMTNLEELTITDLGDCENLREFTNGCTEMLSCNLPDTSKIKDWNGAFASIASPGVTTDRKLICVNAIDTRAGSVSRGMFSPGYHFALQQPDAAAITDLEDTDGANWVNPGTCP